MVEQIRIFHQVQDLDHGLGGLKDDHGLTPLHNQAFKGETLATKVYE